MNSQPKIMSIRFFFIILCCLTANLFAQRSFNNNSQSYFSETKPVVDYYERVDDKSFYQQKRIHSMKSELNQYSEKLHNLQNRFDQIFYGLSEDGSFKKPFDTSNQPQRPVFEYNPAIEPKSQTGPEPIINNPVNSAENENQLAFNVDSPGNFKKDNQVISTFNPKNQTGLGNYFLINSGFSIPHKIHKSSLSYKRYDPGYAVGLAGGFVINNFKVGLGGLYKSNSFHSSSKIKSPLKVLNGESETFAGFLDLSYSTNLVWILEGYLGGGIGYYLTQTEDKKSLGKRKSHDLFLTAKTGLKFRFSEYFALSLGYRYAHEEEVPTHSAEIGLNFDF